MKQLFLKKRYIAALLLIGALAISAPGAQPAPAGSAASTSAPTMSTPSTRASSTGAAAALALLDAVDSAQRYSSISYTGAMEITQGSRVLKKEYSAYARGSDHVLLEFTNPEDRGVRMLRLGASIWMYFPSEGDTIRISGSLMRQGLMGSNLSYEEVAEGESLRASYNAVILREENYDDRLCAVLKLTSSKSDISYPVRILWVDSARNVPLKIELYARSGLLMKTVYVRELQAISGRLLPTTIEIVDALKKNSKTVFSMLNIKLDLSLPDSLFTMQALTR